MNAPASVDGLMIEPAELPHWMPRIAPALEKMARGSGGRFWTADIERFIAEGKMQCWVIFSGAEVQAVFLTELLNFPRLRECRLVACVGHDWQRWAHLKEAVRAWARGQGCKKIVAVAPRKWRHIFTDYVEDHVMLARDV